MELQSNIRQLDIPVSVFVKVVVLLGLLYFLYQVVDILALLFVAIILATAMEPAVGWLNTKRVPRGLSVISVYLVLFLLISLVLVLLIPPLITQLTDLALGIPAYYTRLFSYVSHLQGVQDNVALNLQQTVQSIGSNLAGAATSVVATLANVFGGIVQFIVVLVVAFYLVVEEDGIRRFAKSVTPISLQPYINDITRRIQAKLGSWLRGQLLLMLIIGVMTYVFLHIANLIFGLPASVMNYALVLALWAGLTEIIPYLGPIIGAVPAILLAFVASPVHGLVVFVVYVLVQQLENNIVVPKVMERSVGLNPIVSILVILIGGKLGGVVGAVISIPLTTALAVVLSDYFDKRLAHELSVDPPADT